jgi:hypothetical protein
MRPRSQNNSRAEHIPAGTEIKAEPNAIPAADIPAEQKSDNPADDAEFALKHQIEALRNSEQLQRQRMEQEQQARLMRAAQLQDMRPPSREEKLAAWKQNGLTEANERFLLENPELIDFDRVTAFATQAALSAGHEHDSEPFREAVKKGFHDTMRRLKAESEVTSPTPQYFRPQAPPEPPSPASVRSALVSAPISREVPSGDRIPVPSRITLSKDEQDIAKSLGLSAKDYAEQKRRMLALRARGELQQ